MDAQKAKILICTGIYPPAIGGPAQYAKEVENELIRRGNKVRLLTYQLENRLPTLIRHGLFFLRVLVHCPGTDFVLALDTFSVGWPAVCAAKLMNIKIVVRTGGDFLWESYVERTGDLVLLKDFYSIHKDELTFKEQLIFRITKWTLRNMSAVIFSTDWQRNIFESAYKLNPAKNFVVENFYGEKISMNTGTAQDASTEENRMQIFVAGTRPLKWKNIPFLEKAFAKAKELHPTIQLDINPAPYGEFLQKIKSAYAVILVSLGEISPNMILDAIRADTPFILTKETGIYERVKSVGLFVDPKNIDDIAEKILYMADRTNHIALVENLKKFSYTHSWAQICDEIIAVVNRVQ